MLRHIAARGPHPHYRIFTREGEYSADLWLLAKRELEPQERVIYCEYFLHDRPWVEVIRKTKHRDKGQFFHAVYRTLEKIGRAIQDGPLAPQKYLSGFHSAGAGAIEGGTSIAWQILHGGPVRSRRLEAQRGLAIAA